MGVYKNIQSEHDIPISQHCLKRSASGFILYFTIRSRFVGYHDTPKVLGKLVSWAKSMKQEFDLALNRLQLIDLQQSTDSPSFQIPPENNDYEMTVDT